MTKRKLVILGLAITVSLSGYSTFTRHSETTPMAEPIRPVEVVEAEVVEVVTPVAAHEVVEIPPATAPTIEPSEQPVVEQRETLYGTGCYEEQITNYSLFGATEEEWTRVQTERVNRWGEPIYAGHLYRNAVTGEWFCWYY